MINKRIKINNILLNIFIILFTLIFVYIFYFRSNYNNYETFSNNEDEDESSCIYISSYGIKKSCSNITNCLYINTDLLNNFEIPDTPFILVTGNSINTIPDDFKDKVSEILASPNLIHWYCQNLSSIDTKKLSHIPLGLDYHTIAAHKFAYKWWGVKETPLKQEQFLINLEKPPFEKREYLIYCNFINSIQGRYGGTDRKEALEEIPNELLIKEENKIERNATWKNMTKYAFVLSPHGNGLDCHRTWEALILGCIPIVKRSLLDSLYEDLPVLIVYNWFNVNESLLNSTIKKFKSKVFNYNKLKLEYWINIIKKSKQQEQ